MRLVFDSNQLRGDPDLVAFAADTAFQDVIDSEFGTNLADALGGALVGHARGASDHAHALGIHASQVTDRLLGQPVAEVFLVWVIRVICKGQNGQHNSAILIGPNVGAAHQSRRL